MNYENFYEKSAKKYGRYQTDRKESKIITDRKPEFFDLVKKYANKKWRVLDVGCGSGELAARLAPYFGELIGIDFMPEYIETANKENKLANLSFLVADALHLPFEDESFDLVYSSRGPVSSDANFMAESSRVLKKSGLLLEETIGEKDRLELKEIFGRGQNYPVLSSKLDSVSNLLKQNHLELVEHLYFSYTEIRPNLDSLVDLLNRAPIIPDFDADKDSKVLKEVSDKLKSPEGIVLNNQRLFWVAKK